MSNVKEISLVFQVSELPKDETDVHTNRATPDQVGATKRVIARLGEIAVNPFIGLQADISTETKVLDGSVRMTKTIRIEGTEAVSWGWIKSFVGDVQVAYGYDAVTRAIARDIEGDADVKEIRWVDLLT